MGQVLACPTYFGNHKACIHLYTLTQKVEKAKKLREEKLDTKVKNMPKGECEGYLE